MIRNYLRTALRALWRQKGYSALNIFGLALGIAGALLIFSYVRVDLTWDRFHTKLDRTWRLVELQDFGQEALTPVAYTMTAIGPQVQQDLPEIELAVRARNTWGGITMRRDGKVYHEKNGYYVDSTFFRMFDFPLAAGDPATCLNRPDGVVIDREMAAKYFGEENPLGQTLNVKKGRTAVVTGVLDEFPSGSSLHFDFLLPFAALTRDEPDYNQANWGSNNLSTFVLLAEGADPGPLNEKITTLYHKHGSWRGLKFFVQPLADVHLKTMELTIDPLGGRKSSMSIVFTLASIGLFMLLIASINFVNLATARAARRAREVGMRKVVGATRGRLIAQFFGESLIVALLAAMVAGLLAELATPTFESLALRSIYLDVLGGGFTTFLLLGLVVAVGLLAGLYPAMVLSSFRPVAVLKGSMHGGSGTANWMRRGLVVFQFVVSIVLIVSSLVIMRQIHYIHQRPLGYNPDHLVYVRAADVDLFQERYEDLRQAFEQVPGVVSVSGSAGFGSQSGVRPDGATESWMCNQTAVDTGFIRTMQIELVRGEGFHAGNTGGDWEVEGARPPCLINETFVKRMGWEEPVGHTVGMWSYTFQVAGVVRDFHFNSLRQPIGPLIIIPASNLSSMIGVRFRSGNVREVMNGLESAWSRFFPETPMISEFADEASNRQYAGEKRQAALMQASSGLAVLIACLGLLGLASYATERRAREIGVRKVLGARVTQILALISREFVLLVLIANVIAWPLAWLVMSRWLENYAYRTELSWWLFPLAGIAALVIALGTVTTQALRAANGDPSRVLRDE